MRKCLQFNTVPRTRCKAAREFPSLASWNKEIISTFTFARGCVVLCCVWWLCLGVYIANAIPCLSAQCRWLSAAELSISFFWFLLPHILRFTWNSSEINVFVSLFIFFCVAKKNTVRKVKWTNGGEQDKKKRIIFCICWREGKRISPTNKQT